jgi:NitT/TauT family transport system substrate-binding protein
MTYLIEQNDLQDVELVNVALGAELAAVASGQADYAVAGAQSVVQGIEEEGLAQVYSFASDESLSPFAFSSLTSTQSYIDDNPEAALGVVTALEQADRFIYENPEETIEIAIGEFPDLEEETVRFTVQSMIDGDGFPHTTLVSEDAWAHNMEVADFIGNVDGYPSDSTSYEASVNTELATDAAAAADAE